MSKHKHHSFNGQNQGARDNQNSTETQGQANQNPRPQGDRNARPQGNQNPQGKQNLPGQNRQNPQGQGKQIAQNMPVKQGNNGQNQPKNQFNQQKNQQNQGKNTQNLPKNQQKNGQNNPQNKQNQPKNQQIQQQNKQKNGQKQENVKDTYAYSLDGNLYINLTNKCSNGCDFCVRNERASYFGHFLWLKHGDPTSDKVISAVKGFGDLSKFKELVFCGFGEPTYHVEEMCAVADFAHEKGMKTRLNTNGQGNLINKRDIIADLKGKIDLINVSLNTPDSESYKKICRSMFGEEGFNAMLEFAKGCKRAGIPVRFSIVDAIGQDAVESCKKLASALDIPLYIRKYIADC